MSQHRPRRRRIRFYDHISQYIPQFSTVKSTDYAVQSFRFPMKGKLSSLKEPDIIERDPFVDELYLDDSYFLSMMTKSHRQDPIIVSEIPRLMTSQEHFHIKAFYPSDDNEEEEKQLPLSQSDRKASSVHCIKLPETVSIKSGLDDQFKIAEEIMFEGSSSGESTEREELPEIFEIDREGIPEIPPLATNLVQFLATIPDSAPASLSPFTFCEEVINLADSDFNQFLEEDTLFLKSALFGNRFNEDSIYDFVLSLNDQQYKSALLNVLAHYSKLAKLSNLLRDLLALPSISDLASRIEKEVENIFLVRTAILWVNIPTAKMLINHSRLMQYPHGVGLIGTSAVEKRQVVAPNPTKSPIYSEEYDLPFCEDSELIVVEPITDPNTGELYAVLMLIDKIHQSGASYMYWPQSEITLLKFFSSGLYRCFSRFADRVSSTSQLYKVISKFVSRQLDFTRLLNTVQTLTSQTLHCESVSLYFNDNSDLFTYERNGNRVQRQTIPFSKSGIAGYIFEHRVFVNCAIASDHPAFHTFTDGNYRSRSLLAAPMMSGDAVFGVIVCRARKQLLCFTSEDLHHLSFIAAGAAPALQSSMAYRQKLTELKNALRAQERLASLLQTAEMLSRETNIDTLVSQILVNSCQLVGADRASLFVVDDSRTHLVSKVAQGASKPIVLPIDQGIVGSVASSGETINIIDCYEDPRFNSSVDKQTGYRTKSMMTLPVHNQQHSIIGVVQLINKIGGDSFTLSDVELTKAMSVFTGIALANSIVIEKAIASTNRMQAMLETVLMLMRGESLSSVLHHIMNVSRDLVGADRCSLFLVNANKTTLSSTLAEGHKSQIEVQAGRGIVGFVAEKCETLNIPDAYKDNRFHSGVDQATGYKTRSILASPVKDMSNKCIGVVEMINKDPLQNAGVFTSEDEKLTNAFSSFAGIAFDRNNANDQKTTGHTLAIVLSNMMTSEESNSYTLPKQIELSSDQIPLVQSHRFDVDSLTEIDTIRASASFFSLLGMNEKYKINNAKLIRFLLSIHDLSNSQYYNWRKAVESAQFVYFLLSSTYLSQILNEIEKLALLIAAFCHDIDYGSIESSYSEMTDIALSILYRNKPIEEMHHCQQTISLFSHDEENILSELSIEDQTQFWRQLTSLIFGSSPDKHFVTITTFMSVMYPQNMFNIHSENHRLLLSQIALKCSDISPTMKSFSLNQKWASKAFKMRSNKQSVVKRFNRDLSIEQMGFDLFVAIPLVRLLSQIIPETKKCFIQLQGNYEEWIRFKDK